MRIGSNLYVIRVMVLSSLFVDDDGSIAQWCYQGVDLFTRPGASTWGSQRGMFAYPVVIFAHNLPGPKENILVNDRGHACWIDFGSLTIVAEKGDVMSIGIEGYHLWTSPELLWGGPPTRETDCFSFGMVIYEVLSGQAPLHPSVISAYRKVMDGEDPGKPKGAQGVWFTTEIWATLELCWKHQPADRPASREILQSFEGAQPPRRSSAAYMDTGEELDADVTSSIPSTPSLFCLRSQAHPDSLG